MLVYLHAFFIDNIKCLSDADILVKVMTEWLFICQNE